MKIESLLVFGGILFVFMCLSVTIIHDKKSIEKKFTTSKHFVENIEYKFLGIGTPFSQLSTSQRIYEIRMSSGDIFYVKKRNLISDNIIYVEVNRNRSN
jgi:hypothetical protein